MLKAATKVKNDADLKRVKQIAQETRVETLARLHASAEGLSTKQALINREEYGVNEIDNRHKESKAHFLLEAFVTPFTIILLILIAILLIKDIIPSQELNLGTIIIITVMILITGITSFVQNIKGTTDCHLTRRPNEVIIKVLTLANMLFNMNNGGKGLIIS